MFDTGNTGFMLLCTSLVMLMTPGLAFFYGGLVGRKNVLAIMIQSFVSMGVTTVLWYVCGYSLCFSGDVGGDDRQPRQRVSHARHDSTGDIFAVQQHPALRLLRLPDDVRHHHPGADHRRVHQPRPLQGLPDLPGRLAAVRLLPARAHGLGRRPARRSGACWTSPAASSSTPSPAWRRWPRSSSSASARCGTAGRTASRWSRWAPACCGSAGTASTPAASSGRRRHRQAFLNTDVAASFAAVTWLVLAWIFEKKPKFVGLLTGAVAGLATITPAAGYVTPTSAVLIGIVSGVVCYYRRDPQEQAGVGRRARRLGRARRGRRARHGLLGLLATTAVNPAGADGLIHGGVIFFLKELATVVGAGVYAFVFTFGALKLINLVTPVRVSRAEEEGGLDESLHGEHAYELEIEPL